MKTRLPAQFPTGMPAERARMKNTRLGPGLSSKRILLIEAMVYEGLSRQAAAERVKMTDRAARFALANRNVMSAYQNCLRILRESEKPRSIHRLTKLRDQDESKKVSLEAAKFLATDEHGEAGVRIGLNINVQPGYIVNLGRHEEASRRILREHRAGLKTIEADQ